MTLNNWHTTQQADLELNGHAFNWHSNHHYHNRAMINNRMWTLAILILLVLFDQCHSATVTKGKKCQQYGHSCLGGHGKRSSPSMLNIGQIRGNENSDELFPNLSFHNSQTSSMIKTDEDETIPMDEIDETPTNFDEQIQRLMKSSLRSPLGALVQRALPNKQQQKQQQAINEENVELLKEVDYGKHKFIVNNDDNIEKIHTNGWSFLVIPFHRVSVLNKIMATIPIGKMAHSVNNQFA